MREPSVELDPRFSDPAAVPRPWTEVHEQLVDAELYWLTTVRPDARPHVTPLIGLWRGDHAVIISGAGERKVANLESNPRCVLTTGSNSLREGLDVVVEGTASPITEPKELEAIAAAYIEKYGPDWTFTVRDGELRQEHAGRPLAFRIEPVVVFGFGKGEPYSQTRFGF